MIYDKKVIQQNAVKYGKTAQGIDSLKQLDGMYLSVRSEGDKEKLVKQFNLSPDVSKRILVQENNTIKFPNGSGVYFVKNSERGNCYKSWNNTVHLPI